MVNKYSRDVVINPSLCDASMRLGVAQTFDVMMDTAAEHAEKTGLGVYDMAKKGLGWLTVKTRIHFDDAPKMMDEVISSTWAQKVDESRCERAYTIEKDGKLLISGKTEWAVLEAKTGKLHILRGDIYPEDVKLIDEKVLEEPFFKIKSDFENAEILGSYKVTSGDVDLYGHMNNAKYAYALLSLFSSKELKKLQIRDIELVFKSPCFEGDTLEFRKVANDDVLEIRATVGEKTCLFARIEGNI